MKNKFLILIAVGFMTLAGMFAYNYYSDGTCSAGENCTACSTCKHCKNCSKDGGSCSVCK